jgi:hypothetical protein
MNYINKFEDLDFIGKAPWETPFGKVVWGTDVIDSWYTGYGDLQGMNELGDNYGVDQQKIYNHGNQYLKQDFPKLDYILDCKLYVEGHLVNEFDQLAKFTQLSSSAQNILNKQNIEKENSNSNNNKIITNPEEIADPQKINNNADNESKQNEENQVNDPLQLNPLPEVLETTRNDLNKGNNNRKEDNFIENKNNKKNQENENIQNIEKKISTTNNNNNNNNNNEEANDTPTDIIVSEKSKDASELVTTEKLVSYMQETKHEKSEEINNYEEINNNEENNNNNNNNNNNKVKNNNNNEENNNNNNNNNKEREQKPNEMEQQQQQPQHSDLDKAEKNNEKVASEAHTTDHENDRDTDQREPLIDHLGRFKHPDRIIKPDQRRHHENMEDDERTKFELQQKLQLETQEDNRVQYDAARHKDSLEKEYNNQKYEEEIKKTLQQQQLHNNNNNNNNNEEAEEEKGVGNRLSDNMISLRGSIYKRIVRGEKVSGGESTKNSLMFNIALVLITLTLITCCIIYTLSRYRKRFKISMSKTH